MAKNRPLPPAVQQGPEFIGATRADVAQEEIRARNEMDATSENAHELAVQLGYEGILTVGAVEDEIRMYYRRSGEAAFEMGKRLLILRELTPHGEFQKRVDLMSINYDFANRVMKIARKFSKVIAPRLLKAADSQTKLLELLVLDDSEIESLEAGETVRNLHVSKIETMSYREMKAALLAKDQELSDKERLIIAKDTKLNEQAAQLNRKSIPLSSGNTFPYATNEESGDPEEEAAELREEVKQVAFSAEAAILGSLRPAIEALLDHGKANDTFHEDFIVGCVCQIEAAISLVRRQFGLKAKPDGDERPDEFKEEFAAAAIKKSIEETAKFEKRMKGGNHA